jgi:hypothetical protein
MKQEPRCRLYLLGLSKEDREFLEQVTNEGIEAGRETGGKLVWASDCCFESTGDGQAGDRDVVCKAVKECLEAHR